MLKRLNVYLEAEQLETLKALALRRRTSASGLVIEAVRFLLRNPSLFMPVSSSDTVKQQSGRFESGGVVIGGERSNGGADHAD